RLTQSATGGTPPTSTLTYGESTNRITTTGYGYDANGNLTSMPGGATYSYDVFDRLSGSYGAKYDAFGRRILSGWQLYFFDMNGKLLAEYNLLNCSNCSPTVKYVSFAGHRLGQWTDSHRLCASHGRRHQSSLLSLRRGNHDYRKLNLQVCRTLSGRQPRLRD